MIFQNHNERQNCCAKCPRAHPIVGGSKRRRALQRQWPKTQMPFIFNLIVVATLCTLIATCFLITIVTKKEQQLGVFHLFARITQQLWHMRMLNGDYSL
jgi:hypothetical protein